MVFLCCHRQLAQAYSFAMGVGNGEAGARRKKRPPGVKWARGCLSLMQAVGRRLRGATPSLPLCEDRGFHLLQGDCRSATRVFWRIWGCYLFEVPTLEALVRGAQLRIACFLEMFVVTWCSAPGFLGQSGGCIQAARATGLVESFARAWLGVT